MQQFALVVSDKATASPGEPLQSVVPSIRVSPLDVVAARCLISTSLLSMYNTVTVNDDYEKERNDCIECTDCSNGPVQSGHSIDDLRKYTSC